MRSTVALFAALLVVPAAVGAQTAISVAGRLASHGPGIEVGVRSGHLGLRGGASFFSWTYRQKISTLSFENQIKFVGKSAILDVYPSAGGSFHLSGGVMSAPVEMQGTGRPSLNHVLVINHRSYTDAQVGNLIGVATWPDLSPYAGLGWSGSTRGDRFKVTFDVGAVFGGPEFALTATGATSGSTLEADVMAERATIQDKLDRYAKIYPIVSLGFAVRI